MKTEVAQPRVPYRNEAVFRSAERLIAAAPKKTAARRPSRPLIFALGLACGLALAFLLLPDVPEALGTANVPDETAADASVNLRHPLAPARPDAATTDPTASAATAAVAQASAAHGATPAPPPRPILSRPAPIAPAAAPRVGDRVPLAPPILITQSTTRLKLKGELRYPSADIAPLTINFDLQFKPFRHAGDGALEGLVQVLDDKSPEPAFRVTGVLANRLITLAEVRKIPVGASRAPFGYVFVLELSGDSPTEEISGSWTHGVANGTLVVRNAWAL